MRLEKKIVSQYAQAWEHIWVLTGPIFGPNPDKIKRRDNVFVDIPKAFYCVLVDPIRWPHDRMSNVSVIAMKFPQNIAKNKDVEKGHITTINDIETLTKLNLFPTMTTRERNEHENVKAPDIWDNRRVEKQGRRIVEVWV